MVIVISVFIVALAMLLLSIRLIIKKNGSFGSEHISQSKAMRNRGITCAASADRRDRILEQKKLDVTEL